MIDLAISMTLLGGAPASGAIILGKDIKTGLPSILAYGVFLIRRKRKLWLQLLQQERQDSNLEKSLMYEDSNVEAMAFQTYSLRAKS